MENAVFQSGALHVKSTGKVRIMKIMGFIGSLAFKAVQSMARVYFAVVYRKRGDVAPLIDDEILLQSATELARKIRTRELKSSDVVSAFTRRIKQVNPTFNFLVDERFEEALHEAHLVDERIASGSESAEELEAKQPFLGVPFTFKASIAKRGFTFTAGLSLRKDQVSKEDADVIVLMQEAGAIPIASTNISELCLWWESYNRVHGRTRNPYDSNRGVGGSSGGEGCIQALAASPMGLGSDIGGSIRIPAHFNGVFGHKPTNGIGPLKGHYPYPRYPSLRSFLVIGPMSRYAVDLLPMFKITAKQHREELKLDESVDITKLKYYYMEDDNGSVGVSPVEPEIKSAVLSVVAYLKETYGIEAEKLNVKGFGNSMMLWNANMKTPGGPVICRELTGFEGEKNIKWELFKFLFGSREYTFPVLMIAGLERLSMKYGDSKYQFFMEECTTLRNEFEKFLDNNSVFIYPTMPTAAPYHSKPMTQPFDVSYTALFNWLGYPATHCPVGLNSVGLPIGVQIAARENRDRLTLAVAVELERAFGGWTPPKSQETDSSPR